MLTKSSEQTIRATPYPFLSSSAPQRKKLSPPMPVIIPVLETIPPTAPQNYSRMNAIAAWAALVEPGSPAPSSPQRRPSLTRKRSPSTSRPHTPSTSSSGFVPGATLGQDGNVDLSALDRNSVSVRRSTKPHLQTATALQSSSPKTPPSTARTIQRFRSLGILTSRSKSTSLRNRPLLSPIAQSTAYNQGRTELVSKHKKVKRSHVASPPPLATEVALMQFLGGGTEESNVRKVMEAQSNDGGGTLGVSDVYRDSRGAVWWDQDEETEYAHLLGAYMDDESDESQWIKFDDNKNDKQTSTKTGIIDLADSKHRSLSTQDSELSPQYLILPVEESQCGPEDDIFSIPTSLRSPSNKQSPTTRGLSVLALPSRPHRVAKHLRKPVFMIDAAAFGPRSPCAQQSHSFLKSDLFPSSITPPSPGLPSLPSTPKSARFDSAFALPPAPLNKSERKTRKKPVPLKLELASVGQRIAEVSRTPISTSKTLTKSATPTNRVDAEARREFVDASFAPRPMHSIPARSSPRPMQNMKPRGKMIIASLDPMDDMTKCRELARMNDIDIYEDEEVNIARISESVPKKRSGFGGLFKRRK